MRTVYEQEFKCNCGKLHTVKIEFAEGETKREQKFICDFCHRPFRFELKRDLSKLEKPNTNYPISANMK